MQSEAINSQSRSLSSVDTIRRTGEVSDLPIFIDVACSRDRSQNRIDIPVETGPRDSVETEAGVTILPSVSSEDEQVFHSQPILPSHFSSHLTELYPDLPLCGMVSVPSVYTTFPLNGDGSNEASLTDSGFLSVPSSVPSSPSLLFPESCEDPRLGGQIIAHEEIPLSLATCNPVPCDHCIVTHHSGTWYDQLESERDWEAFRENAATMLVAMQEDTNLPPDTLMAYLIQAEEEYFWKNDHGDDQLRKVSAFVEVALTVATVTLPLIVTALLARRWPPFST
jgi:hypothetical protein